MKKSIYLFVLLFAFPLLGYALSLEEAKSKGLVGEKSDGYLGAVSGASADVQALISDINSKRKAEYERIQKQNNIGSLEQVEKLAAAKAQEKTPAGQFIHDGSGWKKK